MDHISAVIITKNEAWQIANCLKSLSFADEILVLDTGSEDNTIEVCQAAGAKVYSTSWEGFGKTKAKAVSLARYDVILSIDADEVLSSELQEEIKSILASGLNGRAFRIRRLSYYLGKPIRFCGWQCDAPLRLFDRRKGSFNDEPVHESVINHATKHTLKFYMHHHTYPTIESHYNKMRFYAELGAQKSLAKNKGCWWGEAEIRAGLKFIKMYLLKFGFLDGLTGFKLCVNSAWGVWYKYRLLWTKSRSA